MVVVGFAGSLEPDTQLPKEELEDILQFLIREGSIWSEKAEHIRQTASCMGLHSFILVQEDGVTNELLANGYKWLGVHGSLLEVGEFCMERLEFLEEYICRKPFPNKFLFEFEFARRV